MSSENNPPKVGRTTLPDDTKHLMAGMNVDNFALLFNRMAHFGIEEKIEVNNGTINSIIDGKIKAHFFHKSQKQHLNLAQKWRLSNEFKQQHTQFLENYASATKALFSSHEELKLTTTWRVAIGMGNESVYENGFTFHPTYGIPYLPGSSLKGMTRHWVIETCKFLKEENREEEANEMNALTVPIFGNEQTENEKFQQGQVIFFDAFPTALKQDMLQPDIMNNHYPDYYEGKKPPADWLSPRPIFFLTMKNVEFQFHLGCIRTDNPELLNTAMEWLENALLESGVGAKTAVGYGRFTKK